MSLSGGLEQIASLSLLHTQVSVTRASGARAIAVAPSASGVGKRRDTVGGCRPELRGGRGVNSEQGCAATETGCFPVRGCQ